MKRFTSQVSCRIFGRSTLTLRCASTGSTAFDTPALMYEVPFTVSRAVGRDTAVHRMWQKLLIGKRIHVIEGPDGLGKSALAASFCEHCRESNRFSCIQWINARHSPIDQLATFFSGMKGRTETEVLVVLDDVSDVPLMLSAIPRHMSCHYVITSASVGFAELADDVYSFPMTPLEASDAISLLDGVDHENAQEIATALGNVPLLMDLASKLLTTNIVTRDDIITASNNAIVDGGFSVSKCAAGLIDLGIKFIDNEHPGKDSRRALSVLASLNVGDLSPPLIDAAGADYLQKAASQVGILSHKWDAESSAIQPLVAKLLRHTGKDGCVRASRILSRMWPRRMSGRGNAACSQLVWHVVALQSNFVSEGVGLTEEQALSLDRAANYLAILEGRDLGVAVKLWEAVHAHNLLIGEVSEASLRVARDLGRTLYKLRQYQGAERVLGESVRLAEAVHGDSDPAFAVALSSYAPFMPADEAGLARLGRAAEVLVKTLEAPESVYNADEKRMMTESLVVLLLCNAQSYTDMGRPITSSMREEIGRWQQRVSPK